ncbi:bifunctional phosphoribosylaminoimidazole carboxylase/phosphoribosylaminoimidazole succinocarboxamide synthetase isoform X2 [Ascaphus truei]|uniref:bifunctional phosphoribosylaminoimidazole carboxylase/phosphoribosylaminoimidazole succinocarboxamide synthetase isoform X2 n=1 Tax=Ascaphus truei TaxID=8439 RepID=UPI003F599848
MERGAGRYWTEDEIRALMSVWSEKNIKKQLHGTLRNKGLFMYIAKRMQALGVFRDWKQCRAKYKNLKYEYRAIKCGHCTGDVTRLRFYDDLDAILGSETVAELEDEESVHSANETYLDPSAATERVEALLRDPRHGDIEGGLLIIPPVSNEGGKHWTTREIRALLNVWSDKTIRRQLKGTVRNQRIFEHIARLLQQAGIDRDWRQCRTKYKNLKHEYVVVKKAQESGNTSKTMKFFSKLDAILSSKASGQRKDFSINEKQTSISRTDSAAENGSSEVPETLIKEINVCKTSADLQAAEMKTKILNTDMTSTCSDADTLNCSTVRKCVAESRLRRPLAMSEGGKHWTTDEITALITVWSDRNIRQQLEGTVRNRKIFEHIASLLQNLGVDRDWRQCRTKYKNLKHEYIVTKRALGCGDSSKCMKFFNELDDILQHKVSEQSRQSDTGQRETSLIWTDSTTGCHTGFHEETYGSNVSEELRTENVNKDNACTDRLHVQNLTSAHLETHAALHEERSGDHCSQYIKQEVTSTDDGDSVSNISDVSGTLYIKKASNDIGIFPERDNNFSTGVNQTVSSVKEEHSSVGADSSLGTSDEQLYSHVGDAMTKADVSELQDEAVNHLMIVTVNEVGAGRNWSDHEVRSLLHVWSDERICRQLEGTFRNKELFEEISRRLLEFGINRDWKQCRTKYKNLKYEYYGLRKDANRHMPQGKAMKFYHEIDCIIRRPADGGSDPFRRISGQESSREINEDQALVLGVKRKHPQNESQIPDKRKTPAHAQEDTADNAPFDLAVIVIEDIKQPADNMSDQQATFLNVGGAQLQCDQPGVQSLHSLDHSGVSEMEPSTEMKLGKKLNEGKTKEVYELPELPGCVLMQSKDQITAGNAARKDHMEGKAFISNKTTSCIFKLLQEAGIKTAFVRKCSKTGFIATHCEMIPIEWVCRRIATGSFLKRNPGVKEGYKFYPPKVEMFFKDDANNDPQWSEEQLIATKLTGAGLVVGQTEVDIMNHSTVAIFEILEKAWLTQDCTLVDMKIEFGVDVTKKEIVLADVIDNDSWRLWPSGDKTQQKDKQTYRDLKEITPEAMQMVKRNFEWVADRVECLQTSGSQGRVVVLMGSISDLMHCEKIKKSCANYGIPCELRVTSAHKGPDETLRIKAEYEGDGIPTVFIAVAGRSNGLGPVMSGNTAYPVINCPPLTADWGAQDIWSSLRMPSGLGCATVLSPEAAAQFAAQIFGLSNHLVWSKLRSCTLNTWISLKQADMKLRECSM